MPLPDEHYAGKLVLLLVGSHASLPALVPSNRPDQMGFRVQASRRGRCPHRLYLARLCSVCNPDFAKLFERNGFFRLRIHCGTTSEAVTHRHDCLARGLLRIVPFFPECFGRDDEVRRPCFLRSLVE